MAEYMTRFKSEPGSPYPFGVKRSDKKFNFAIYSKNASGVKLYISSSRSGTPSVDYELDPNQNKTGDIWHICVIDLPDSFYYFYQVSGPWEPESGLTFKDDIKLVDPYAQLISGLAPWSERSDNQPIMASFQEETFDWEGDRPLNRPLHETIIYEVHVRGFTRSKNSGVQHPGTFSGIAEKAGYLKELGITAVELLPVHEFDEEDCRYINPNSGERLKDYWGYSSINFFAVKSAYSSYPAATSPKTEFKKMVKTLHREGIEVILDVVFNHTAEGGWDRKIINFKGLGNKDYYLLDDKGDYLNLSGCGNTVNCNHPVTANMIVDSLRFFVTEYHVDGFRFDLASILSRGENGDLLNEPLVLNLITKDPVLSQTKLIAEPWDAVGLYQVGGFCPNSRWAEWNDRFRDSVRRFGRGEPGCTGELATRLAGSEDLFGPQGKKAENSINFITAHDGFTMMDLVSYETKHNNQNGQGNQDGASENFSLNFGVEGKSSNEIVLENRLKQIRNYATILLLSQGTPMVLSGDEFGNSQQGNNNAWCQDNSTTWLDWDQLNQNRDLFLFWQQLIAFRKRHNSFMRRTFFTGEASSETGLADISWHNHRLAKPGFDSPSRSLALLIDGTQVQDDIIYIVLNFEEMEGSFELPYGKAFGNWREILDTADPVRFIEKTELDIGKKESIQLAPFSIKVLLNHYQSN